VSPDNIPATGVSLQEYVEAQVAAIRHETDLMLATCREALAGGQREITLRDQAWRDTITALQRAVDKAENEMRQKLAIMNEFRGALTDQAGHFVQREQFEDMRTRMEATATKLELEATLKGRETRFAAAETRLTEIEQWKNNMQGRLWGVPVLIGVVVFVITQLMRVLFPADGGVP
jgi:hypothetical protein